MAAKARFVTLYLKSHLATASVTLLGLVKSVGELADAKQLPAIPFIDDVAFLLIMHLVFLVAANIYFSLSVWEHGLNNLRLFGRDQMPYSVRFVYFVPGVNLLFIPWLAHRIYGRSALLENKYTHSGFLARTAIVWGWWAIALLLFVYAVVTNNGAEVAPLPFVGSLPPELPAVLAICAGLLQQQIFGYSAKAQQRFASNNGFVDNVPDEGRRLSIQGILGAALAAWLYLMIGLATVVVALGESGLRAF